MIETINCIILIYKNNFTTYTDTEIPQKVRTNEKQIKDEIIPSIIYFSKYQHYNIKKNALRIVMQLNQSKLLSTRFPEFQSC